MKKLFYLIKHCDCSSSTQQSNPNSLNISQISPDIINNPISISFIPPKKVQDEEDLSPDSTFDTGSSKKDSMEFTPLPKCFQCADSQFLSLLNCKHSICTPCLETKIRIFLTSNKSSGLKCLCDNEISSKSIEKIIKPGMLIRFLNETGIVGNGIDECRVCGYVHAGNCVENYKENVDLLRVCHGCNGNEKFLLKCGHNYCAECLKKHAENSLSINPFGVVTCKDCENLTSIIPVWILNKIFGNSESFFGFKSMSKHKKSQSTKHFCMICLKKLDKNNVVTLDCGDRYCKKCISGYFEQKIQHFTLDCSVLCPHCSSKIDPLIVQGNISPEVCEDFLEMLIKSSKHKRNSRSKIVWCVHSKHTEGEVGNCKRCLKQVLTSDNKCGIRERTKRIISILACNEEESDLFGSLN